MTQVARTGTFISTINNVLADHIAERIEFAVEDGIKTVDLEEFFPPKRSFPQRELIEAGEKGLYDQVQVDSQVEVLFVENRLRDCVQRRQHHPPSVWYSRKEAVKERGNSLMGSRVTHA